MSLRGAMGVAFAMALLMASSAHADTVVNPFSGGWSTTLSRGVTGTVKFRAISEAEGIPALQAMSGHLCGAPTAYYHGDYTDTVPNTGTMTACIVSQGHLVGRYRNSNASLSFPGGALDIKLNSAQNAFGGFFTSDGLPGEFPYNGVFVSHFPGDGCCLAPPPPPPEGGSLGLPTRFCGGRASEVHSRARAVASCAQTKLLNTEEKAQAREDLKAQVLAAARLCSLGLSNINPKYKAFFLATCVKIVDLIGQTLSMVHDPPDHSFRSLTIPPMAPPAARYASGGCPRGFNAKCAALNAALSKYAKVVAVTASVAEYVAIGANRLAGAVQANSPASAFFQEATGKVNAGALATDLAAQQAYGQVLAKLLRANHLDLRLDARNVSKIESRLPSSVISAQLLDKLVSAGVARNRKAARKLLVGQLTSISGRVDSGALGASLPSAAFARQYRSITLSELAAIVGGLARQGSISSSNAQTLTGALANAQAACANPAQRTAAIQQFIVYARGHASASDAEFLRFGALPLTTPNLSASSCQ